MLDHIHNFQPDSIALSQPKSAGQSYFGFGLVRILLATLLIVAAYLKADNLLSGPAPQWSEFLLVLFELSLAGVLLSSVRSNIAWWMATSCFGGFACVAFYKMLVGEQSCGCFGAVSTSPWVALTIDLLALAALILTGHSRMSDSDHRKPSLAAARFPSLRAIGMACILIVTLKAGWTMAADRSTRTIDPHQWISVRLPLLDSIDIGNRLAKGEWLVVLHRPGCGDCEELIEQIDDLQSKEKPESNTQIAIISMGESTLAEPKVHASVTLVLGALSVSGESWIPTPLIAQIRDGLVSDVAVQGDTQAMLAFLEARP